MGIDAIEHLVEVLHIDEGFDFTPLHYATVYAIAAYV